MTGSIARTVALLAAVTTLAAAGGCGAAPDLVANPTYQGWVAFEPGANVTFQGTRKSGQTQQEIRITQRLLEKSPDRIVLERSVQVVDGQSPKPPVVTKKIEPARIEPQDNPRTRPDAQTKDLGQETVQIQGRAFSCRVSEVQVHVQFGEPLPAVEDLRLRTWAHPDIPGGTARLSLDRKSASHSLELSIQAVEFQAQRGPKE